MDITLLISVGMMFLITNISLFSLFFTEYFMSKAKLKRSKKNSDYLLVKDSDNDSLRIIPNESENESKQLRVDEKDFLPFSIRIYIVITLIMFYYYFGLTLSVSLDILIETLGTNPSLERIYLILMIIAFFSLLVYLLFDCLYPLLKYSYFMISKRKELDNYPIEQKFLSYYLQRNTFELTLALLFSIGSFLSFVSSQILLWVFIIY